MATEDFTSYTEVDEDADITVTASKCDVSTMRRDALSYVRFDYGENYFTNFESHVTVGAGAETDDNANVGVWALSNGSNTEEQMSTNGEGIKVYWYYEAASGGLQLYLTDFDSANEDLSVLAASTPYYLIIRRIGTLVTCEIYSDAVHETLVDTLTVTGTALAYRYIYGVVSRQSDSSPAASLSAYCENLELYQLTTEFTDGLEDQTFNKWSNGSANWQIGTTGSGGYDPHSGDRDAWLAAGDAGDLISDDIDLSGASTAIVDFWILKDDIEASDFILHFYNGVGYDQIIDLDTLGADDVWLRYTAVLSGAYLISNFRLRFEGSPDANENVYVDDVAVYMVAAPAGAGMQLYTLINEMRY